MVTRTRTVPDIIKGMPFAQRNLAKGLYERGTEDGVRRAAAAIEQVIYDNAALDDEKILQLIGEWVKEAKKAREE